MAEISYDDLPDTNLPFAQTHPERIAALATLFGIAPPPLERCRVLHRFEHQRRPPQREVGRALERCGVHVAIDVDFERLRSKLAVLEARLRLPEAHVGSGNRDLGVRAAKVERRL
jgi:hypothetical protein